MQEKYTLKVFLLSGSICTCITKLYNLTLIMKKLEDIYINKEI